MIRLTSVLDNIGLKYTSVGPWRTPVCPRLETAYAFSNFLTAHEACIDDIIMFVYSVDCVFHATCNFKMIKINIIKAG